MLTMKILVLILSVIACGVLVLLLKIKSGRATKLLLSFSGAYILALCLFHLIPEVYSQISNASIAGWSIVTGFLLQLVLDYISGGIEHGHIHLDKDKHHHHHDHDRHHDHPVIEKFPVMMMVGLCIHAFIEGFPLFFSHVSDALFVGIIFHNIPISITLTTVFLMAGRTALKSFGALFIFSLMTPAGALAAKLFFPEQHSFYDLAGPIALGIVIGIFLHISTTILFESDKNHRFNLAKLLTVLVGVLIAFFLNQ